MFEGGNFDMVGLFPDMLARTGGKHEFSWARVRRVTIGLGLEKSIVCWFFFFLWVNLCRFVMRLKVYNILQSEVANFKLFTKHYKAWAWHYSYLYILHFSLHSLLLSVSRLPVGLLHFFNPKRLSIVICVTSYH